MPQWSISDASIRLHVFLSSSEVRKKKTAPECELGVAEELFRASQVHQDKKKKTKKRKTAENHNVMCQAN